MKARQPSCRNRQQGVGELVFETSHGRDFLVKWWRRTFNRDFNEDWGRAAATEKLLPGGYLRDMFFVGLDCGDGTGDHSYRVVVCNGGCYVERFVQ